MNKDLLKRHLKNKKYLNLLQSFVAIDLEMNSYDTQTKRMRNLFERLLRKNSARVS